MRAELRRDDAFVAPGVRSFRAGDEEALGGLMFRAYQGTLDDEGETLEQAHAEIRKTMAGAYGAFCQGFIAFHQDFLCHTHLQTVMATSGHMVAQVAHPVHFSGFVHVAG